MIRELATCVRCGQVNSDVETCTPASLALALLMPLTFSYVLCCHLSPASNFPSVRARYMSLSYQCHNVIH